MKNFMDNASSRTALFVALLYTLPCVTLAGEIYKWVDNEGNVQFGNTIPPEYIKNKHSTLSEKGREVESKENLDIEKELAQAKRLKEEEEKRKRAEEEGKNKERAAYDKLLLESYLTEQDLLDMRNRQVETIDGIIKLTDSNIKKLNIQLEKMNSEAEGGDADSESGKKLRADIDATQKQIAEYKKFIDNRHAEQERIKANFDRDLNRLRELLAVKK